MDKLVIDFLSDVGDNNEYRFCIKECAVEHCHPQKVPESGIRDYFALHRLIFVVRGRRNKPKTGLKRYNLQ